MINSPNNTHKSSILAGIEDNFGDKCPKLQADASIEKHLNIVKAIFSLAFNEDAIQTNPAQRVTVTKRNIGIERIPWDQADIAKLFSCDIFQGALSPKGTFHLTANSDFWMPIIAILSGMRCEEIGQMIPDDIQRIDDISVFNVSEIDNAGRTIKRIKTRNSRRIVPIHPILIEIGLLSYVDAINAAGHCRLFPDLKPFTAKNGSIKFTKYYSGRHFPNLRQRLELTDPRKPFHAFRHTIKAAWKRAGVPLVIQHELLGHATEGGAAAAYAREERTSLSVRAEVIRSTVIPGLPHIPKPTSYGVVALPRDQFPV
ncbi:MAG: site-specific integrase [Azospirillaceae bacterium]|nr:site-specific integrase [Azospirillaceae bacterium]